ncbi:hypothetical protein [Fructobacillus ficulneus]|uniref:Type 2 lantibiotic biosynthesis protein LanM n=1 Tax=Fructobacillus ficulneus TaxID=157463 RepID=A0A0K8MIZ5_9LACO|nr:hypothetical protein [Fructobacillus ficulneus]GAP00433.1 type 2 lantibiotic biosynthesis protein LanM [Fructobacillus ficulneus]
MNLPVTSTKDYLLHVTGLKRVKFDAFFLGIRDNILNHRDQRVALQKGEVFKPRHHQAHTLRNKRVITSTDRYAYRPRAEKRQIQENSKY